MKTLGICIPTYKRPEFLRRCILSAIESAQSRPIRIFVADDSVSDVNAAVLTELAASHLFIHVRRNENNLGIDANIQVAVDICDCDYAWLIGEDDEFLPRAVAQMFDLIQQRNDPFIFANYRYVSEDHRRLLGVALPDALDGEYSAERFIAQWLWSVGFIGSCVLQCRAWRETSAGTYLGTYFAHVGRILDMLHKEPRLWILARPNVANRAQGDDTFTWKKDSFGVFLGFERMCRIAAQKNVSLRTAIQDAALNYRHKFAYLSVKTTFRLRSEGAFDLRQFRTYITKMDIEAWRKAWLLWLALMPRAVMKPLARAYVASLGRHRSAGPAPR